MKGQPVKAENFTGERLTRRSTQPNGKAETMGQAENVETFRQYTARRWGEVARRRGLSIPEVAEAMPEWHYWAAWRDYVVSAFQNGATIRTKLWRTMDESLQHRILRTSRALRDDALTSELRGKLSR